MWKRSRKSIEILIAELEGRRQCFVHLSGLAAIIMILYLFKTGDNLIISKYMYEGTFRLLNNIFNRFEFSVISIDVTNLNEVEKVALSYKGIKGTIIETPVNQLLNIVDLNVISKTDKKYNLLNIDDNTFLTPYSQKPLSLGADIAI
jgi:cystathionine beta-lyase/cystathionine gamma-synthase